MNLPRALVTGATGHIGSTLCRALHEQKIPVIALVRPSSDRRALAGLDVELAEGDVLDPSSLERAVQGCGVVFHAAACFDLHPRDAALAERVTVEGTRNMLAAARGASARVVLTSSVAVVGGSASPSELRDEDDWFEAPHVPYYKNKLAQEREAVRLAGELGVELVRVLPTLVLGPGDHRVTPSSRVLVDGLLGKGVTFEGGTNVIDVRDVALGMVAAATRGRSGGRYILGGDNVLIRDLGAAITKLSGKPMKHVALPAWAMSMLAATMELSAAVTGGAPPLTRAIVRDLYGKYAWYDVSRARTELGLVTRPLAETLRDAAAFFAAIGVVPRSSSATTEEAA